MRNPLSIGHLCLVTSCAVVLCASGASAQNRAPLRPDLQTAAEHLMHHPHPYAMSEEVARQRLNRLGFENAQSLRPTARNTFEAEASKNGAPRRVEIDRITGAVKMQ
jgi:hypothetical protein